VVSRAAIRYFSLSALLIAGPLGLLGAGAEPLVRVCVPGLLCGWSVGVRPGRGLAILGAAGLVSLGLLFLLGPSFLWVALPTLLMALLLVSLRVVGANSTQAVIALMLLQFLLGMMELWIAGGGQGMAAGYAQLSQQLDSYMQKGFEAYLDSSGQKVTPVLETTWKEAKERLLYYFPAILGLFYLLAGVVNVVLSRIVSDGRSFLPGLAGWHFSDHMVWLLIASGAAALFGHGPWEMVGKNGLLVLAGIYVIQGVAIAHYHFERNGVSLWFRAIFYMLITLYWYGLLSIALLGLLEVWWRIRPLAQAEDQ